MESTPDTQLKWQSLGIRQSGSGWRGEGVDGGGLMEKKEGVLITTAAEQNMSIRLLAVAFHCSGQCVVELELDKWLI